ncbi:hypothetical protein DL96DRAFT_1561522 [Flagelloscypha sp. PMI_526]|nr:hypothetical protein DL96DRAFT_1561522 [Flagelloscypha sp. PMI_526]
MKKKWHAAPTISTGVWLSVPVVATIFDGSGVPRFISGALASSITESSRPIEIKCILGVSRENGDRADSSRFAWDYSHLEQGGEGSLEAGDGPVSTAPDKASALQWGRGGGGKFGRRSFERDTL